MIVTNALFQPRDAEKAGNDELVSSVTQLVECMHRQASPGTGGIRNHRDAADRALMAATDAERRIVELRERIAQLEKLAAASPQKLNWKTSIVDLLKLLDIDSSYSARKELATELGCPANLMGDSAQMNMWLHKTVLKKIADNGGNVPKELLD